MNPDSPSFPNAARSALLMILFIAGPQYSARADSPAADPPGYAVPESPAAAIASSSASISRPTTPDAAGLAAITAFDGDSFGSGWSVAYDPGQWINATSNSPKSAINMDFVERFLYRLELSAAAASGIKNGTTAANANSTASDLGFGLRDVLVDETDPRFDSDLRHAVAKADTPAEAQKAVNDWKELHWNSFAAGVGSALNFTSATNQYSTLRYDGGEEWLTGGAPLWAGMQLLGNATYRFHQYILTKGVADHQSVSTLGAQIRIGQSKNGWDGYVQCSESWKRPDNEPSGQTTIFGVGAEYKVNWFGGLWLQAGWSNNDALGGHSLFGTSVRYALAPKPAN